MLKQETGAMLRIWRSKHPLISLQDTQEIPALPPSFVEYRRADLNALILLYGAVLACIEAHRQPPKIMYISPILIPVLHAQYPAFFHYSYNGYYHYLYQNRVIAIPIESSLPSLLKLAVIPRDTVIAVL